MKKLLILIFFLPFVLSACGGQDVALQDLQGKTIKFSSLRGKWVFINYWATWCKPCYKEVPALNAFANSNKNVVVFGVSYDQLATESLDKLTKKMGIHFSVLRTDPASRLGLGDIEGLPITFVFSPKGKLVKKLLGAQTQESLLKVIG